MLAQTNHPHVTCIKKKKKNSLYQVNTNGTIAEQAFFELGKKHNAGVWDIFDIMGGLQSMELWQSQNMAKSDKIHFTNAGYTLIGDLLYNALIDRYMEHLTNSCRY